MVIIAHPGGQLEARLMTPRETARLMGLPDDYRLPKGATHAYQITGDGVAVPVAAHLARALVEPLLDQLDANTAQRPGSGHDLAPALVSPARAS
jgi:DNA (cytosine-5)-methyltransferase 1